MAAKKCPVCAWTMEGEEKTVEVKGRKVAVCCDDCAAKLKADPAKYMKPRA
jgi:ribosome-binding protein aMBF1 (putative translation factor)